MSAQNRVTPFGTIEALPGRGTLMGNRGSIHEGRSIKRPRFRDAWPDTPLAVIDATLHEERLRGRGRESIKRTVNVDGDVPDGAMVTVDGRAWLVLGDALVAWTSVGYGDERRRPKTVTLLTPPSTVAAMRNGYTPMLHATVR